MREHGTAVLYARLDDWRPDRAAGPRLRELLGRDWARYLDLTHPDVRIRFAASRILLKYAAGTLMNVAPEAVEIGYRDRGRPYLRGNDSIDVSLSHTDGLLLVGLTTRGLIGVDAEPADREMYEQGLAKHLCTPYELEQVEALPEEERNAELIRLWTLKEAYSKALGIGLQFRFTDFGFGPQGRPTGLRGLDGREADSGEWAFRTWTDDAEYVLSAAVFDFGFGSTDDTRAKTMLDPTLVDALMDALGEEEPEYGDAADW